MSHLSHLVHLLLIQQGICCYYPDCGICRSNINQFLRINHDFYSIKKAPLFDIARASDDLARLRVNNVTKSINCNDRPDSYIAQLLTRGPQSTLGHSLRPMDITYCGPRTRTDAPLGYRPCRCGQTCLIALIGTWPYVSTAQLEIEENSCGNYRHLCHASIESATPLL